MKTHRTYRNFRFTIPKRSVYTVFKILLYIQGNVYPYLSKVNLVLKFFQRPKIPTKLLRLLESYPVLVNFIIVKLVLL